MTFKDFYNPILFIVHHNLLNLYLFVGCLHCFQSFGTINNIAVNILVHKFICISLFPLDTFCEWAYWIKGR